MMYWNRKMRRTAAGLLGLLLCLSGCTGGEDGAYTTVHPDRGTVERSVEDNGTVTYGEDYTIVPLVGGKVLECTFSEGDTVTAGETLYVIDSGELEDQITQAVLSLSTAQASYAQAQAACADLSVRSAASGTVTNLYVHVGDYVSTGSPVADLVDSYHLTLTVPFSVTDAASFTVGSAAQLAFSGTSDTVAGTVKRIYDTPTVLSGGRSGVYVEISFLNPGAVDSGATATATVGAAACMEAGTVAYGTQQSIYASQSGQVLTLPIQTGSAVSAGDEVMTLKNDSLTNAVTNAALSVETAQVNLSQLEDKREDYIITAPVDGVILSRTSKTGDLASAGSPMATLAQPEALCVHADIDEQYIDQVGVGQSARITFTTDSGEQRTYSGTVERIDDAGVVSGGVTNYTVELSLESSEGLRDGMNVTVSILTGSVEDCLRVPQRAVADDGTVQVLRDGKAESVEVETGLSGGGYTEIRSGLTESDQVIVP